MTEREMLGDQLVAAVYHVDSNGDILGLIEAGAALDMQDKDGNTALMYALDTRRENLAILLIEKGAKPDVRNVKGQTALMFAAWHGQARAARALIEAGADVEARSRYGDMPLKCAREESQDVVVRIIEAALEKRRQQKTHEEFMEATKAFRDGLSRDITIDPPLTARARKGPRP